MAIRRETYQERTIRKKELAAVQTHYPVFVDFLDEVMHELGFPVSWLQADIANYLQYGPDYRMIQAQRGQAKSTITAAYAVWTLVHKPRSRVLIVSAGGDTANEISTLVYRIIMNMDILECLRPDKSAGDRTSTEGFDVHYSLKGMDKSPSVASVGITGTLQGKRADLLIADDIESTKNALTASMREHILDLSRDFTSQCTDGQIVYLGTPQSQDSIYNTLPGRGFDVRIWPGRYPTATQEKRYGDALAPSIKKRLLEDPSLRFGGGPIGDDGQPTDSSYITEDILMKKWRDQGESKFMLNHMLDTSIADALRYPLKTHNLIVMRPTGTKYPMIVSRSPGVVALPFTSHTVAFTLAVGTFSEAAQELQGCIMYVDPAGGGKNGDETGYAVTGFLNGNVYVLACGGVPGGYDKDQLNALADIAAKWKPQTVIVEKNMGYGAFKQVWLPILLKKHQCMVEDDYVTGNKERRICDTLEPVMGRGALILSEEVVDEDRHCCERYSATQRATYSLFHQINKITREPKALKHDDRLDALAGAVAYWLSYIAIDQDTEVAKQESKALDDFMRDPFGHSRRGPKPPSKNLLDNYRR